jgi:malate synthase
MPQPNQYARQRPDVTVSAKDLLDFKPAAPITEAGVRNNISVGIQYLGAWLAGNGCVPVFNLMEDAATAEISRTQVWQWVRHGAKLADGRVVTNALVRQVMTEELDKLRTRLGPTRFDGGEFALARQLFDEMMTGTEFPEFLTTVAYDYLDD